jgi:hypothetical protein
MDHQSCELSKRAIDQSRIQKADMINSNISGRVQALFDNWAERGAEIESISHGTLSPLSVNGYCISQHGLSTQLPGWMP